MVLELLPYVIGGIIAYIILNIIFIQLFRKIKYGAFQRRLKSDDFLKDLVDTYVVNHSFIDSLLSHTIDLDLDWSVNAKTWSIGECLKHIALWNGRYIPILEKAITKANKSIGTVTLSGRVVYLSDALLPDNKNGNIFRKQYFRTKTKKRYNPKYPKHFYGEGILQEYLSIEKQLIETLQKASDKDLNKWLFIKDDFGFGFRFIRLGELMEVLTAHNMRHYRQLVTIYQNLENYIRDRSIDDDRSELLSLEPIG